MAGAGGTGVQGANREIRCTTLHGALSLPQSVQEIADVIGRERALFLVGQLPVCFVQDKRYKSRPGSRGTARVILYVPKRLKPDHPLVAILGWQDAQRMVDAFGGEILCPPTLRELIYRPWRDAALCSMARGGMQPAVLAQWFGLSEQRVRDVLNVAGVRVQAPQTPQEAKPVASNDNRRPSRRKTAR